MGHFLDRPILALASMLLAAGDLFAGPFAYVTNAGGNNVSVIDTGSNTVVASVAVGSNPISVAVNSTGTRAYVVNNGNDNIAVIDTAGNALIANVGVGSRPMAVALNPAGTRAYVSNYAGSVSVIDTGSNAVAATIAVGSAPVGIAVNPAGTRVYVANNLSNNVSVIDTGSNSVVATIAVGFTPDAVAVNAAGTRAYVTNQGSNSVSVINTATNTVISTVAGMSNPWRIALDAAGSRAYVTNYNTNSVSVIDTASNTVVAVIGVGSHPKDIAISAGARAYVANFSGNSVSVIDLATNSVFATIAVGNGPTGVAVSPVSLITVPGAPTINTIVAGNARASVWFSPPASDGGSPITSYVVRCTPGNFAQSGATSPITVTGLANGTAYSCAVAATNAIGTGPASSATTVTPSAGSPPGAPTITGILAGNAQVTVSFAPPASDGGSPIMGYAARCSPDALAHFGAFSPITVTGLANGTTYSCTVSAINAVGTGLPSAAVTVTPLAGAPPPVFPMTVTGSVTNGIANVQAQIQFRPQDVGTTESVYVFALAPSTIVRDASTTKNARVAWMATGVPADVPVQCVLAQLGASGQLQAVSESSLRAYISGVLSSQGQAVEILNGVPTANIAGATFYVGYGTSSTSMIDNGTSRSVFTVPANLQCQPQAPQTGWWWNPAEDGRGFSMEVRGSHYFFAAFLYDVSGRSMWYVSTGAGVSLDGSLIKGDLLSAKGGQSLGGAYPGFPALANEGPITLAFSDQSHGTLLWPGGVVPIRRFDIVPNGLSLPAHETQPEAGWWWNPDESGRGFFLEWQGGVLDIAGYMYDDAGDPVWYLTENLVPSTNLQQFSSSWWSYANGQTLMGAWRPNVQLSNNVAPVTIQFHGAENAVMTLPNGRTTALTRHRF